MASSRRSTLGLMLLVLALLPGCRAELATDHPVPPVADAALAALLEAEPTPQAVRAAMAPTLGPGWAEAIADGWATSAAAYDEVTPGPVHVVRSHGVSSANLDVLGDGHPIGRLRVVVGPDGEVREAAILRAWDR